MRARFGTLALVLAAGMAVGQDAPPRPMHAHPAVNERLAASYLTDEERAELRRFHGVWTSEDLETTSHTAAAALMLGRYDHPSLMSDKADPADRAEAAIRRGEPGEVFEILRGAEPGVRAVRLHAEALFTLGRHDEAARAVEPIVELFASRRVDDTGDIAEGVRALMIRARVLGSELGDGGDFRAMLGLLGRARDEIDRLDWRVRLAEAILLYERHNRAEANAAIDEVLGLNPRCAEALALRGRLAVDAFNFDAMNAIAAELDRLAMDPDLIDDARALGSVEAHLIEAGAWLRQRNVEEARIALSPVLARFPDHREALALDAAAWAVGARTDEADAVLERLDELSPGAAIGPLTVGAVLAEARQYHIAPAYLEEAARRLPNDSTAPMELGLMELQAGRDSIAIELLSLATQLDPFNSRANNSLKLAQEVARYETIETDHFVIRYADGIDAVFAQEMPMHLERLYDRVTGDAVGGIDHEPTEKTIIDVLPDHAHFAVRITGMPELWTIAASTGPLIAMEAPRAGPGKRTGPFDWARVLQHEFTHTVTLSRSSNRIPHWMTEGMSVFLEDAPRDEGSWGLLARAFEQGRLFDLRSINVAFVRPEHPSDRSLAYAQGEWLIEYVNERFGPEAPRRILDEVGRGASDTQAFETVLEIPVERFLADFEEWAHEDLIRVGLELPDGVPTFEELGARDGVDPVDAAGDKARLDLWLAEFPNHPEVLEERLAMALRETGGTPTDGMLPLIEAFADAVPVAGTPHRLLSRVYLSSDDPETQQRAVPHLEFLDAREQSTPAFAAELARLAEAAGDHAKAHAHAERTVMIAPYDARERERAARVAILAGNLDAARRHLAALVQLEPDREQHKKRLDAIDRMISERSPQG